MTSKTFTEREARFSGRYARSVFQSLRWAWSEYGLRLAFIALCGLCGRVAILGHSLVIGYWADDLCNDLNPSAGSTGGPCRPTPAWLQGFDNTDYLVLLASVIAAGVLLTGAFLYLMNTTGTKVGYRYHDETILRVSRAPMRFFDKNPVGRILARFSTDFQHLLLGIGPHLGQIAMIFTDLSIMVVMIGITNAWFLPLIGVGIGINYLVYRANKYFIRRQRRDAAAQRAPSLAHFASTVQGFLSIRVFLRALPFTRTFEGKLHRYLTSRGRAEVAFHTFGFQMSSLTAALAFASGLLGIVLLRYEAASVGEIGVVLTFVTLSTSLIQRLFVLITSLEKGMAGAERLNQYLQMDLEPAAGLPTAARYPTGHPRLVTTEDPGASRDPKSHPRFGRLEVQDLRMRYEDHLPWVLDGLNLRIDPGETIGVVGRTGSGKSTLFQTLLYLYPAQAGRMQVDGLALGRPEHREAHQVDLLAWRRFFAYVTQEPAIFRGSLRENLAPDPTTARDEELQDVIERVGLGPWVAEQGRGLDAWIEEGGANLSAGQRQLLASARCLTQNARIVLMDEATSAIDPNSEEAFVQATEALLAGRTTIIIAHRLSTIERCDRILWLADGRMRMFDRPDVVLPEFERQEPKNAPPTEAPQRV